MVKHSSLKYNSHEDGNFFKMVIDEMSNLENTKHEEPNVIARLMGIDTLPKKTGSTIHSKEVFDENLRQYAQNLLVYESNKADLCSLPSSAKNSALNCNHQYSIPSSNGLSSMKSLRRKHPQEEQLNIFKKEFLAWKESRLREFSSNLNSYNSEYPKKEQNFALENINKEEIAVYKNGCTAQNISIKTDSYDSVNKLKITQNNLQGLQHDGNFGKKLMSKVEDDMTVRRELEEYRLESASSEKFQERRNLPSSSTRIVILKPSSDMSENISPEVAKKFSSMEDFLEEVKEKLRLEIEGKGRNDSIKRLSLGHTSVLESSKQMAREAAKHGAILRRSQSMTNYRNQSLFDGHDSSKSIRRETRKFISDRLKNVLKDDTELKKFEHDGSVGKLLSVKEIENSKLFTPLFKGGKDASFWEDKKAVIESIPKHLRHEQMEIAPLDDEFMSNSKFFRSFSASALGEARLEDCGGETKAQNSQKFEATKNDSTIAQKIKKDSFSIKNTVSNLRRNFGMRAKIFRKKASSMAESTENTVHYVNQDEAMPSVFRNFGIVQDNSTEVPPTPASFPCSPVNDHHSPVSPLEGPFMDYNSSAQVSGELSMILTEFENQTEHVDIKICGIENEEKLLTEGSGEAFVRDILLVSGFYTTSWPLDELILSLDGQIKPISSFVFDEVDAKYRALKQNVDDGCSTVRLGDVDIDLKMLFDLVNESLPSLIDAHMTRLLPKRSTRFRTQFPQGRKLLDDLLDQIHVLVDPKVDQRYSTDERVVWDLKMVPWSNASDEDICVLSREVEWMIISDLVDDLSSDLLV